MSRKSQQLFLARPGFPRMRGDEPGAGLVNFGMIMFSPHARG